MAFRVHSRYDEHIHDNIIQSINYMGTGVTGVTGPVGPVGNQGASITGPTGPTGHNNGYIFAYSTENMTGLSGGTLRTNINWTVGSSKNWFATGSNLVCQSAGKYIVNMRSQFGQVTGQSLVMTCKMTLNSQEIEGSQLTIFQTTPVGDGGVYPNMTSFIIDLNYNDIIGISYGSSQFQLLKADGFGVTPISFSVSIIPVD